MRTMTGGTLAAALLLAAVAGRSADEPQAGKAPWQRLLQGDDARKAAKLNQQIHELRQAKKWAEAVKLAQELAVLRQPAGQGTLASGRCPLDCRCVAGGASGAG